MAATVAIILLTLLYFCCSTSVESFAITPQTKSKVGLIAKKMNPLSASTQDLTELTLEMSLRAKEMKPFSETELDEIILSLKNVAPKDCTIDFQRLRSLIREVGHLEHKDWDRTGSSAAAFRPLLLGNAKGINDEFKKMFKRVINEGNWNEAVKHSESGNGKPWVVLVTGR